MVLFLLSLLCSALAIIFLNNRGFWRKPTLLFLFTHRLYGTEASGSISFHENYGFWVSIQYCQL